MAKNGEEASGNVGTELLFENERVRVWGMALAPGESSPFHRHECDYVFIYNTPSRIALHRPDQPDEVQDFQEQFVQFTVVGDGIEHRITNAGDTRHQQIIVELRGQSASSTPLPPENNGRVS